MRRWPETVLTAQAPHRRRNPLTGDWVLVSPDRVDRPWQGKIEAAQVEKSPSYDPDCYLCPGNRRAGGAVNPNYVGVYAFDNDFGALVPEGNAKVGLDHPLLHEDPVQGLCRVLCFSPRHDLSLAVMSLEEIGQVVALWIDQLRELEKKYRWVQIFENRGEIMGCSNPHPHGQLWASSALPNEPAREDSQQRLYRDERNSILLLDYLEHEKNLQTRVIIENEDWAVLVPYWAVWPFETLLIPRRHVRKFADLDLAEQHSLAMILKRMLIRYDNLFSIPFPYTMGWHGAPADSSENSYWQLHAHFYPPLLRSATVRKFMVGYEMLSEPQRDITPEAAAERLRLLTEDHYSVKRGA